MVRHTIRLLLFTLGVMCAPGLLGTEAEYCAAGDRSLFISYQKTLNYIIEFAIEHGITGAYNRKFAYAGSGYSRGFNLKKPETTQYRTMNPNGAGAKKADGKASEKLVGSLKQTTLEKISFNLTRYGDPGGGHHVHMKKAYESHPLYNLNEALCLSNEEMTRLGIDHDLVSRTQRILCESLKKTGNSMTREEMNRISVQSLVAGGAGEQLARDIVAKSQWDLRVKGIRHPTDMPWGKKGKGTK